MAKANLKIEGMAELIAQLEKLKHLPKQEVQKGLAIASAPLVKAARANLVKNGSVKTKRLYRSIRVIRDRLTAGVVVGPTYAGGKNNSAAYAHLVEFGTKSRKLRRPIMMKMKNGWRLISSTGKMPAKPFLEPAREQAGAEVVARASEFVYNLIKRESGL
jgi:HK97 gp10 family phage protein